MSISQALNFFKIDFFKKKPGIDAVLFLANYMGLAGLQAFKRMGLRIPEDISIISYDDHYSFKLHSPSISVIEQPIDGIAVKAANPEMFELLQPLIDHSYESDEDEATIMVTRVNKNHKWIIDSGCSHHMIGDKSKFITFTQYDGNSVRFGNNAPCLIKGKGSIKLTKKITCDNAYYVEGLNYNLLSVS